MGIFVVLVHMNMLTCVCVCMCVHVMLSLYDRIEISASAAKCITKVEEVFGGVLVSTLICRDCLIVSARNCMRTHRCVHASLSQCYNRLYTGACHIPIIIE